MVAHALLTGAKTLDERASAIDEAERLLRKVPFAGSRDDGLEVVEAARYGDVEARRQLATSLEQVRWGLEGARDKRKQRKPRGPRKATLADALKQAAKANVPVSAAVIGADGITIRFGEGEPTEASNPWLDDLKVTKQ